MNEQLQEALRVVHAGRRALWLAGAMQERRDLSAAHDPSFDDAVHAPIRVRCAEPRGAYSHPRSPNAERSTPGGAYHPAEP